MDVLSQEIVEQLQAIANDREQSVEELIIEAVNKLAAFDQVAELVDDIEAEMTEGRITKLLSRQQN